MPQKSTNIYQIARETAGITQERAAEAIGYSVESIKAYENDYRIPPDKAVVAMIDVYGTLHLGHQHVRHASTIGRDLLPDVSEKELAEAVISFFASIPNLQHVQNSLINIAADGVIDDKERTEFNSLMENLGDMVKGIYDLKAHI